ncbi:hypothetical protein FACS189491_04200 [Spirochaetia bacterium]|nr:hypothetical protein FACS189491_04200 [Spirochaetia bacterium]
MNDNILERAFIDTCVCVYLYSDDEPDKKIISENAVNNYDCVISTQVLKYRLKETTYLVVRHNCT